MKEIFSSPRFWLIVIIALLQSLSVFNILSGEQVTKLIDIISLALGGVIALRTIDRQTDVTAAASVNKTVVSMPKSVSSVTATKKGK